VIIPRPLIVDECPPFLIRAFDSEKYARAFLYEGKLRLRNVRHFCDVSDARHDPNEGIGALQVPGDVPIIAIDCLTGAARDLGTRPGHFSYSQELINPTYIFCCSTPDVARSLLRSKFDTTLVRIHAPGAFFEALRRALDTKGYAERALSFIECFPVRYDKGAVGQTPDHDWRTRLSYGQKPPGFREEHEFRCAVVLRGGQDGAPECLDLTLEDPLTFCEVLVDIV
jgi:hypothetical protein